MPFSIYEEEILDSENTYVLIEAMSVLNPQQRPLHGPPHALKHPSQPRFELGIKVPLRQRWPTAAVSHGIKDIQPVEIG